MDLSTMKTCLPFLLVFVLPAMHICNIPVSQVFYNFSFQDKLHEDWILSTLDDGHVITCLQNCRDNKKCTGLAVSNYTDEFENYTRTCHTLSTIDLSQCDDEGACSAEGMLIYQIT